MQKVNDSKKLAFYISNLSTLELKTSKLYDSLSQKTKVPIAKSLMLSIAQDSSKHATLLQGVSRSISPSEPKPKELEKSLETMWPDLTAIIKDVEAKEDSLSLEELYEKLMPLESSFGEEYITIVHMQTLQYMTKEINQLYNFNLDGVKSVFESIIKDEEHHREILITLKEMSQPEIRDLDNTPLVKYQSPDRWVDYGSTG